MVVTHMPLSYRKDRSFYLPRTGLSEVQSAKHYRLLLLNQDKPIMIYALSWFLILSLLAVWSLAAWSVNAIAMWMVSNAGVLTGAASDVEGHRLPQWLASSVPPEIAQAMISMLSGLPQVVESLLEAAPALAGGLNIATWIIWALGCVLIVFLGIGLHLLVAMWRRRGGGSDPRPVRQAAT